MAWGRVLGEDSVCGEPLPPFTRSTRDGYAVRAADTLGCSISTAARLTVTGEIAMGTSGQLFTLLPGQAVRIWTGGELPLETDAVVMVEYTRYVAGETIAVLRPVVPGENLICAGEDYAAGERVLTRGYVRVRLTPEANSGLPLATPV